MGRINKYAPIVHTGFANTYTDEQIRAFIDWCAETGYSGFSAEGKSNPPTNDIEKWAGEYLHCLHTAAKAAEEKGIDVWIFDEWGFPSGTAAGLTLDGHPEYRCKSLYIAADYFLNQGESVSINVPNNFIVASAWPVKRDAFSIPSGDAVRVLPNGDGKLVYTATNRRERFCAVSYAYGGHQAYSIFIPDPTDDRQGNLDTMSWEGTRRYLDVMHERYAKEMPEQFGKAIRGFFYDEPFMIYPNPYTFGLIEEFKEKKGYDILPRLAAMVAGVDKEAENDWRDVCTTRMSEAFFGQMADWCHEHNLELVGHQDLDHDVRSLDSVSGNFFKNSMKNDSPGVDYIWDQLYPGHFADFPRFAGSVKHVGGKAHALSESFAATGYCMFPDYMRWAMEYQMIRGIDRFYLMIADPNIENNAFRSPIAAKHPVSKYFGKMVNEHVTKTNQMLCENAPIASVALYIPMRDISDAYPPVLPNRISLHMPWEWVNDTAKAMLYAPLDYEYIWDEAILSCPVETGALVTPAGQRIETIVIPAVERLPEKVLEKLLSFHAAGGKIVCVCAVSRGLIGKASVVVSPEEIAEKVCPTVCAEKPGMLSVTARNTAEGKLYFVLNEDYQPYEGSVLIPGEGALTEYCYQDDEWYNIDGADRFEPMQLRVFRRGRAGKDAPKPAGDAVEILGWKAETPTGEVELGNGLADWREFTDPTFTGFVTYRARFETAKEGLYRVSLGRVCYSAIVNIDGVEYRVPFAPYAVNVQLAKGGHEISVKVLNTDINSKLGSDEAERQATEREYSLNYASYETTRFVNDRRYVTSGLLGPVTLTEYR